MSAQEPGSAFTMVVCVRFVREDEQTLPSGARATRDARAGTWSISDFDTNAIEAALALRDQVGGRVVALSFVTDLPTEAVLLQPPAMGVDESHIVRDPDGAPWDAFGTARVLAATIRSMGDVKLIFCGDSSVDENRGEVGPRLAEELDIISFTHVTRLDVHRNLLRAERSLENLVETVETSIPVLVTVGSETNQPRMPTLRQIRQAPLKPIVRSEVSSFPELADMPSSLTRIETLRVSTPNRERREVRVSGDTPREQAAELLQRLLQDGALSL